MGSRRKDCNLRKTLSTTHLAGQTVSAAAAATRHHRCACFSTAVILKRLTPPKRHSHQHWPRVIYTFAIWRQKDKEMFFCFQMFYTIFFTKNLSGTWVLTYNSSDGKIAKEKLQRLKIHATQETKKIAENLWQNLQMVK